MERTELKVDNQTAIAIEKVEKSGNSQEDKHIGPNILEFFYHIRQEQKM